MQACDARSTVHDMLGIMYLLTCKANALLLSANIFLIFVCVWGGGGGRAASGRAVLSKKPTRLTNVSVKFKSCYQSNKELRQRESACMCACVCECGQTNNVRPRARVFVCACTRHVTSHALRAANISSHKLNLHCHTNVQSRVTLFFCLSPLRPRHDA